MRGKDMQSEFTDRAREALNHASKFAGRLKQGYVGTEHILAGLLREEKGVAHRVLKDNGVGLKQVLDMIQELIAFEGGVGLKEREGYSPRAKKILEEAHRQAARFGQKETGTEHLLMAIIKEGENVAFRLLNTMGINVQKVYADTLVAIGQDAGALLLPPQARTSSGVLFITNHLSDVFSHSTTLQGTFRGFLAKSPCIFLPFPL